MNRMAPQNLHGTGPALPVEAEVSSPTQISKGPPSLAPSPDAPSHEVVPIGLNSMANSPAAAAHMRNAPPQAVAPATVETPAVDNKGSALQVSPSPKPLRRSATMPAKNPENNGTARIKKVPHAKKARAVPRGVTHEGRELQF